jgi:hypothetical protein
MNLVKSIFSTFHMKPRTFAQKFKAGLKPFCDIYMYSVLKDGVILVTNVKLETSKLRSIQIGSDVENPMQG